MIKVFSILFLFLLVAIPMGTADASTGDGLAMLKNSHTARAGAMGVAVVSLSADPNLIAYNPAAAAGLDRFTASFGHTEHWENIRFESGHFGYGIYPKLYLHGGIRYATDGEIEQRDSPSEEPIGYFDANDFSAKIGAAYMLDSQWTAGVAFGWWFEEIAGWRGSSFNVDLGIQYQATDKLSLGASAIGIGPNMTLERTGQVGSREVTLPTTYSVGGSYRAHEYALVAGDLVIQDDEAHGHLGIESDLHEIFSLRAGYMLGYDSRDFSAGAAFRKWNITVDYAFVPFSNNLGSSHLFNLTFSL